jgi:hypothetical protein
LQIGVAAERKAFADLLQEIGDLLELELMQIAERGRRREGELVQMLAYVGRGEARSASPSAELDIGVIDDLAA